MVKSGYAFHVHHDKLVEFCSDYDERVEYIKKDKPKAEQELRLRLFQIIPMNRLPQPLIKAREAYGKAREACNKAWEAYGKAREAYGKAWEACNKAREACEKALGAYDTEMIKLHQELCPNCPWNQYIP